jgi:hypothetical protein
MGYSRLCESCEQTAIFFIRFMVSAGIKSLSGRVVFSFQGCHFRPYFRRGEHNIKKFRLFEELSGSSYNGRMWP